MEECVESGYGLSRSARWKQRWIERITRLKAATDYADHQIENSD